MAEYIKKQDALEIIKSYWHESYDTVSAYILDVPAADARPVVHGRWEWHGPCRDNKGMYWATCSACKTRQRLGDYESYCPKCGAKMDFGGSD